MILDFHSFSGWFFGTRWIVWQIGRHKHDCTAVFEEISTCLCPIAVDASHEKFRDLYMKTLKDTLSAAGRDIDYIVVSHTEPDHSGVLRPHLAQLMNLPPHASHKLPVALKPCKPCWCF